MGKSSKRKQMRRLAREMYSASLDSCYLCLRPFREGEQAVHMDIADEIVVNLCLSCADEMQQQYPEIKHLGHLDEK